jgi:hypothetical protein
MSLLVSSFAGYLLLLPGGAPCPLLVCLSIMFLQVAISSLLISISCMYAVHLTPLFPVPEPRQLHGLLVVWHCSQL